jgi:hypothetical protein
MHYEIGRRITGRSMVDIDWFECILIVNLVKETILTHCPENFKEKGKEFLGRIIRHPSLRYHHAATKAAPKIRIRYCSRLELPS